MPFKKKPFVCDCGDPAVRRDSCRSPICQRCYDMDRTLNITARSFAVCGKPAPKEYLPTGDKIDWEARITIHRSAGASIEILDKMLNALTALRNVV